MSIERQPFTPTRDQEERDKDKGKVFTIRLNEKELEMLEAVKKVLSQPKDGTALKLAFEVGFIVLHTPPTDKIIPTIFKNKANNWRTGASDPDMF
jgi:hypothetical protein